MISIANSYVNAAINIFQQEIDDHANNLFIELSDWCNNGALASDELAYVGHLLTVIDEIIVAPPTRLTVLKEQFEKIITEKIIKSKAKKGFRDELLGKLNYTSLRSTFYPEFYFHVGIKACVYCNAMLTVSVEKDISAGKKGYRAKYQMDHYFAKTKNPCLSISLFNLYPICANCNIIKGVKKVDFQLYQDITKHVSPFLFRLQPGSKGKYISTRKLSDIQFKFLEPKKKPGFEKFNDLFDIEGIYKTQLDVIEELILKKENYTPKFRWSLEHSMSRLFKSGEISGRLITGNYINSGDTHKRPLAKITRDIAIEIDLLPKNTP